LTLSTTTTTTTRSADALIDAVRSRLVQTRCVVHRVPPDGAMPRVLCAVTTRALAIGDAGGHVALRSVDVSDSTVRLLSVVRAAPGDCAVNALDSLRSALVSGADEPLVRFWHVDRQCDLRPDCHVAVAGAAVIDVHLSRFGADADAVCVTLSAELALLDRRSASVRDSVRLARFPPQQARFVAEQLVLTASGTGHVSVFDCRKLTEPVAVAPPLQSASSPWGWGAAWSAPPVEPRVETSVAPPLFAWQCDAADDACSKRLDVVSRRYVDVFAGHRRRSAVSRVRVALSHGASLLASVRSCDRALKLWSLRADSFADGVASCDASAEVQCAAFAPDDRHVVAGLRDGSLAMWRSHEGGSVTRESRACAAHATGVLAVTFCGAHSGVAVASLAADGVRLRFACNRQ
jgi:hypothetical protein